jgi:hypothetical protein
MKIIKVCFYLFLILSCLKIKSLAQDTIILNSGKKIISKVIEIGSSEISYQNWNSVDKEIYYKNKSSINSIRYKNGLIEKIKIRNKFILYDSINSGINKLELLYGNRFLINKKVISKTDGISILKSSQDINIISNLNRFKKLEKLQPIGFVFVPIVAGIGSLVFIAESNIDVYNRNGTVDRTKKITYQSLAGLCLITTIISPRISIFLNKKKNANLEEAIKLYNEKY